MTRRVELDIDAFPAPSGNLTNLLREALKARRNEVEEQFKQFHLNSLRPELDEIALVIGKQRTAISVAQEISWCESVLDIEFVLLAAAADKPIVVIPGHSSVDAGPATIRKNETLLGINRILQRYSCPLNIIQPSERKFFEECLRYLMVVDRVQPVEPIEERLRWLLLSLVSLRCRAVRDIRALDVLNYFWERLSRPLPASTFVCSFFGNYDAALERNL